MKFTAPVITDSQTDKGVESLLKTVNMLSSKPNTVWANAEAERLDNYFTAMSRYLTHAVQSDGVQQTYKRDEFKNLISVSGLKQLYNDMAAKSQNTLLSEVAVLPDDLLRTGPASHLFKSQPNFNVGFSYNGRSFDFGFLRVYQNNHNSSTTFPIFTVDHNMVKAVKEDTARGLLQGIQKAMTYVNHDVLHHFNMPLINASVVHPYDPIFSMNNTRQWECEHQGVEHYYEEWSHIAHEVVLQEDDLDNLKDLNKAVDHYFDQLSMLTPDDIVMDRGYTPLFAGDVMMDAREKGQEWLDKEIARRGHRDVVDFYGTMMLHVLSRTFSFDHPIMIHAMDRMADIDPDPECMYDTCIRMMFMQDNSTKDETIDFIRDRLLEQDIEEVMPFDIYKEYRKNGFDLFPDNNDDVDYRHLKMVQLISISHTDVYAHVPSNDICYIGKLRKDAGNILLSMVDATAKDAGRISNDTSKKGLLQKMGIW